MLDERDRRIKRRWAVAFLAVLVFLSTMLVLALPGISMTDDTAADDVGIVEEAAPLPDSESGNEVDAASDEGASEESAEAAEAEPEEATAPAEEAPDDPGLTAPDASPEPEGDSSDDSADTPERPATTFVQTLKNASAKVKVSVKASEGALPAGTQMLLEPIKGREVLDIVQDALAEESPGARVADVVAFGLGFRVDGQPVEPAGELAVKVARLDADAPDPQAVEVLQIRNTQAGGQGALVLLDDAGEPQPQAEPQAMLLDTAHDGQSVAFDAADSAAFVLVETTIEGAVLASDGTAYRIAVTCPPEACVPADAQLEVSELDPASADYTEYVERVEDALDWPAGSAGYTRLFDIRIVHDGQRVQPAAPVEVAVRLDDAGLLQEPQVLHFADSPELVEARLDGDEVRFEAAGFSVYAITEGTEVVTPRAVYHFLTREGANQDSTVETQIIKSGESLSEVPVTVGETEAFLGWYIWDGDAWGDKVEFDTPIAVSYADDERSLSSTQVILTAGDNDVYLRPRYSNRFASVRFLRADENTIEANTETILNTVKVGVGEGQSGVTYAIPDKDVLSAETAVQSYEFVGWSAEAPKKVDGKYQYYSPDDDRATVTELTLENNETVNLYPVFKQAHWITFKSAPTGSGATYFPPAWVENGQTAASKKPADDPAWNGYRFKYWTTTPTFDESTGAMIAFDEGSEPAPFDFDQELADDITLYGYWESGMTTYTVITWKQVVTDDKDASPENRHYEFAGQEVREGKVGDIVNLTSGDTSQAFTGFHHKSEQDAEGDAHVDSKDVVVASGGTTVLNVYYDRDLITMKFYNNGSNPPSDGYDSTYYTTEPEKYVVATDDNGTQYALVDGEYVQLGRTEVADSYLSTSSNGQEYVGTVYEVNNGYVGNPATKPYDRSKRYAYYNGGYYYLTWVDRTVVTWYLNGKEYTGPRYKANASGTSFWYTGLYGQSLEQNGYTWPSALGMWRYYTTDDASGMSYLGEFVLPGGVRDAERKEIRLYRYGGAREGVEFFLQNDDGTYPSTASDKGGSSSGNISFTFSEKFDGYNVAQYRVRNQDGTYVDTKWADTANTDGTFKTVSFNSTQTLEIRYARKAYNILFLDPTNNSPIAATMENGSTATSVSALYGADISSHYPASGFEPQSKTAGVTFNGRWYSDAAQTIQIFFHEKGDEALTEDEEKLLWYYVDTSGEKYYTGYVPTEQQIANATDRTYGQDQATVITEMPMHDLPIYPGWSKEWYWIKIDPNGGQLPDGASTWFWETYGGDKVQAYEVTRQYIQDDNGSYYYHYDEFNTADPDGVQPDTRRAYYTTDETAASDVTKRYRLANSEEEYLFVGWYQVNSDDSLTPYNFDSEITGNLTLRAVWAQTGDYKVRYSLDHAVDVNGNALADVTVTGTPPVDTYHYAEDANAMVKSGDDPVGTQAGGGAKYFLGWMVAGGNDVLRAGDLFKIDPALAVDDDGADGVDLRDTLILYPVFGDEEQEISTSPRTALILDANGGTTTLAAVEGATVNDGRTQISYADRQINAAIVLPAARTGSTDNFVKDNCEFLGWAFSPNAKTPEFLPGQTVGIDNIAGQGYSGNEVNTLYAVWHQNQVRVKVLKVDGTSSNQNRKVLPGASFELAGAGIDTTGYTSNDQGYLANGEETVIALPTPQDVNGTATYSLAETEAPTGYERLAGSVSISVDYDGGVTYVQADRFNGATQTAGADADGVYILEVANSPSPVNVVLWKEGYDNTTGQSVPLAGADFTMYQADGTTVAATGTSQGDGAVFFSGKLPVGTYWLEETSVPAGYYAPLGRFKLVVAMDEVTITADWNTGDPGKSAGSVEVEEADGAKVYKVAIRNVAGVALPVTGGSGTAPLRAFALALLALSVALLLGCTRPSFSFRC